MIVLDASAVLEVLLRTSTAPAVEERIYRKGETLHAPHLLDVEVAQVLRRYLLSNRITEERAGVALDDLASLPLTRYPHDLFLRRIWGLRGNLTAYDAAYVALAEALRAPLLTCDARLAASGDHGAEIVLPAGR
ncbi:MAG: type II toxin-antitoxin system VapC family toxin [Planctomycetes bacterium]|nr:type II toxin-antitoxin system VapC family toxin [Planctomycetota bacterium]